MSNRASRGLVLSLCLLTSIFAGNAFANGPFFFVFCNEEVSEGPHCGVEVKCYDQNIEGHFQFLGGEFPEFWYSYFFTYDDIYVLCTTEFLIGNVLLKQEHRCTENQKGRDEEGDMAVEVIVDFTGCTDN